jgi:hypothetical protein
VSADEPRIVLGNDARQLRRQLGATAWAVLEDLLTDAAADVVVSSNVRRVAEHVGVSKDTAARALKRLIHVGLVERAEIARSSAGVFAPGAYALCLERLAGVVDLRREARATNDEVTSAKPRHTRPRRPARTADQLTLIDLTDPAS